MYTPFFALPQGSSENLGLEPVWFGQFAAARQKAGSLSRPFPFLLALFHKPQRRMKPPALVAFRQGDGTEAASTALQFLTHVVG